ncbi:hypothetical protein NL676_016042 [Syzygium grande]|nr:hypothetical protein NL676_016042 [Syzygium grande]
MERERREEGFGWGDLVKGVGRSCEGEEERAKGRPSDEEEACASAGGAFGVCVLPFGYGGASRRFMPPPRHVSSGEALLFQRYICTHKLRVPASVHPSIHPTIHHYLACLLTRCAPRRLGPAPPPDPSSALF